MTPLEPRRVLIVEDDPASLAFAHRVIAAAGYAVLEAPDATTALEILKNHRVDLALVDMVLPDRSGLDLARAIRALPDGDALPLVAMSAHFSSLDEEAHLPMFAEFVAKPFAAEELVRVVQRLLPVATPPQIRQGAGRSVVVVDDDPVQRRLIQLHLEHLGFEVVAVADGEAALERCHAAPPDAVVSDALMPRLDGFELCLTLRTNPATATIPVVIFSSQYIDDEDEALARRVGATRYVIRDNANRKVVAALLEALDPAIPHPPAPEASLREIAAIHGQRVARQLERQARLNHELRARVDLQQKLLSVSAIVAESMMSSATPAVLLERALAPILSANGWVGAVAWIPDRRGVLHQACTVGWIDPARSAALDQRIDLIHTALATTTVLVRPAAHEPDPHDEELLRALDVPTLIILPLVDSDGVRLGAVALLARNTELTNPLFSFVRTLRHALTSALSRAASEQRYLHAQKMDGIGQLAAGVAHDVNNILTAVSGFTGFARAATTDDGARRDLDEVLKLVDRGAALTHKLLAFSRTQAFDPTVVSPDAVIDELLPMLGRLLPNAVELRSRLDCPDINIRIDRNLLEQSLVNLVVNARDAMPRGGQITVATARAHLDAGSPRLGHATRAGEFVTISVADNGAGMNAATAQRVFEPFFTTKPLGKGTGLGLSAVYGIVTQAEGHVSMETAETKGTTFYLTVPVTRVRAPVVTPRAAPGPGRTGALVLLVEDELPVRTALKRMVELAGHRVITAVDGADALELARAERGKIDLLITDVGLPGIDGVELAIELRVDRPDVQIILITGNPDASLVHARQLAGHRLLLKPFRFDALLAVVGELLE